MAIPSSAPVSGLGPQSQSQTLSPAGLAHVVLRTQPANFRNMTDFYKRFLGAHASHENDFLSFLTYDDEHHRIAIAALPDIRPRDPKTCGLEHIAFTFSSLADLLLAYRQRKAQGIHPIWAVNHGVTLSIYYRDPDGNQIETQVDCFASPDEATAYMRSADYIENPIGVDFDPEEFIARLEGGVPERELYVRPRIGPRGMDSVPLVE
ncbi:Glyoxalase/Bleomycin resistance protein/Dihydroxybiphenyl dioxygenase [Aspergillus carlsbadensis]|nr:Glyoxalase/Bleomycin resistance protein/Dihydroxybiphenyl dioxygenase [Aspergillus carlsbadensis]